MATLRYCPSCGDEFEATAARCPDCDAELIDQPPVPLDPLPWGELETIAEHINLPQAELVRTALEAAGIRVHLQTDDCGGMRPHLWLGGVFVQVLAADAERARLVLRSIEEGAAVNDTDEP